MELKIIATGSDGNCALLTVGNTNILIDAGFSTNKKMEEILIPEVEKVGEIDAVLITHGHGDHLTSWTGRFCMDRDIPMFINEEHYNEKKLVHIDKRANLTREVKTIFVNPDSEFKVGDVSFFAVKAPHSALGQTKGHFTLGYVFMDSKMNKLAFISDIGFIPNQLKKKIKNVNHIALEFNFYHDMMMDSDRNHKDKIRNIGKFGHLSNEEALGLVKWLKKEGKLETVITLHPSNSHNDLLRLKKDLDEMKIRYQISEREKVNETIIL